MKVGIISDTHDDVTNTNKAIDIFEQNNVGVIIHAGDIISPPILKEFRRLTEINVKIFGVFGNNDGEKNGLKEAFEWIGGKLLGDVGKVEIDEAKLIETFKAWTQKGKQNPKDRKTKIVTKTNEWEIDGLNFCIYHGHDIKKKNKMINSGKFDVFVYGHSHNRDPEGNEPRMVGHTMIFNPGTAHSAAKTLFTEPQYFRESSILIFDTQTKNFEFYKLE